ncbi:MAG: lamin tail domain-containing protein [Deltaproteobacteria bacterium]|jgi:uncharacterized protein (TIGR03382 family)
MRLSFALVAALFPSVASAQVVISEVQPNPNGSDAAEWIEIHNAGATAVSIAGWIVNDFGPSTPREYTFGAGVTLAADEVIIVARQATAFTIMATTEAFPVTTADFELADGADDVTVPNLAVTTAGTGGFALGNSGDGVQLRDDLGAVVSTAEWGSGRTEVPGTPAPGPASGESIVRVANSGDAQLDFIVVVTPTPGTGFVILPNVPPVITVPRRAPFALDPALSFSLTATVVDVDDGVASVVMAFATAGAPTGTPGTSYYDLQANSGAGSDLYSVGAQLPATMVTDFNELYVRVFVRATDAGGTVTTSPPGANSAPSNPSFYWENFLPAGLVTPIATARDQDVSEVPLWDGHSVRVEGVALTTNEAFDNGSTNFFIADTTTIDAIRVFDFSTPTPIAPGDLVRVVGKVGVFRGVRQIGQDERADQMSVFGPEVEVTVIGSATVPVRSLTIAQLLASAETYESQLVEIADVSVTDGTTTWPSDGNVDVSDGTGALVVRSVAATDLPGNGIAPGPFLLRGIFTQFAPGGTGGYQLQPRSAADVVPNNPIVDGGVPDGGNGRDGGIGRDGGAPGMRDGGDPRDGGPPGMRDGGAPRDGGGAPRDGGGGVPRDGGAAARDGGFRDGGPGAVRDGGAEVPRDAGVRVIVGGERESGGCGCTTHEKRGGAPWFALIGVFWLVRRRRPHV